MDAIEIIDYIKQQGRIEIPSMQLQLGITYKEAKSIVDDLLEKNKLVYENGLSYVYLEALDEKDEEKLDGERDADEEDADIEDDKLDKDEWSPNPEDLEDEYEEIDEDEFDEEYESEFQKFLKEQEEELRLERRRSRKRLSAKRREAIQNLANVLTKLVPEKQKPVSANYRPQHTLWKIEYDFIKALEERFIRLIKSDIKMGKRGALKKAEAYLEAVRDTRDGKMVQVYERLVYEIKNTSDYMYAQIRKQIWGRV